MRRASSFMAAAPNSSSTVDASVHSLSSWRVSSGATSLLFARAAGHRARGSSPWS